MQIRETPNKKHHKFIEFYDVRAAEAALRSLNKSEIAGKRIKLEPSRPGGTRRKYGFVLVFEAIYLFAVPVPHQCSLYNIFCSSCHFAVVLDTRLS